MKINRNQRVAPYPLAWTTEDKFILKLLFEPEKAKSILPPHAPDWTRLVEKARQEGVSAVLFHNITKHSLEDLIPPESYRDLSNHYYSNLKRNMAIIGKLRQVLATFQEAGIPCIVLKGIALAEHVYPNIATRGMSDVDILVKKDDLFKVDDSLSSLGYISRDSSVAKAIHNPVGYLASLEYRKDAKSPLNLHVHWHTVNTSVPATMFVERIDINRLWENSAMAAVADSRALILSPEHLIIYLCEHALRIGHSFDRLILVCDIFFSIKAFENIIDWNFVSEESRRFGLSRFVYYGLTIVKHYTSLDIPDECIAHLKPSDMSWGEKYFLKLQFNNQRIRGSSYFIYLAMNRGLFAKLEFIARTFFPPAPILLQRRHGIDHKKLKSFYWSRMREIITHIWGSAETPP
ncbi:MAG: nucleotidyltransferase family protein [Deltaproteobacteria bacterium]